MTYSFLETRNIGVTYKEQETPALSSINLSIAKGEFISLLGQSGSGKSSLLRILAGLLDPTQGYAVLENEKIKGPSEQLVAGHEHIRLVAQGFQLAPNMRVWENLRYFLLKWPKARQEQRIEELLHLCGLEDMRDKYPRELSGGQQQRLALGRALSDHPTLLLLDEPFSHLDPALRYELRDVLNSLMRESKTTALMATHNPDDALFLSDRVAVIRNGILEQVDTPKSLYNGPTSPYVASFFGRPNFISPKQNQVIIPEEMQGCQQICIREEDIKIKKNKGIEANVLDVRFLGEKYQVLVHTEGGSILRINTKKASWSIGQTCFLKIKWERAFCWF